MPSPGKPEASEAPPPRTEAEWRATIDAMDAAALFEAAVHANTAPFVREMLADGYSSAEVAAIFTMLAVRLRVLGVRPPAEGIYDLLLLADSAG